MTANQHRGGSSSSDSTRFPAYQSGRFREGKSAAPSARLLGVAAIVCLLAGLLTLLVDVELTRSIQAMGFHGEVRKLVSRAEVFGHFWGLAGILAVLVTVRPEWHRKFLRIAATAITGGLLADLIKVLVLRPRPRSFGTQLSSDLSSIDVAPMLNVQAEFSSKLQSFPSAHTALAFGFAIGLAAVYPRGRRAFFILACLCGFQRVLDHWHFPGDVLCGASVGCFAGLIWYHSAFARDVVDPWERGTTSSSDSDSRRYRAAA